MAKRGNADLFEVLIGQLGQKGEIDIVLGKTLRVLGHAKLFEPIRDLLHQLPMACYNRQSLKLTNSDRQVVAGP